MGDLTGLIVCGGGGRRLGPLAGLLNKSLFPVREHPIVIHVVHAILKSFECERLVFLTGHLAWQVEHVIRAYAPDVKVDFMRDNSALGTADAVCNALSALALERFVYAHGNIALGDDSILRIRDAAKMLDNSESLLAVSEATIAPTHPTVRVRSDHIIPARQENGAARLFSVGFGLVQGFERGLIEKSRSPGCTLEDHLFGAESRDGELRVVDIGPDWQHLEDLAFYAG